MSANRVNPKKRLRIIPNNENNNKTLRSNAYHLFGGLKMDHKKEIPWTIQMYFFSPYPPPRPSLPNSIKQ